MRHGGIIVETWDESDLDTLARTIYGEARGESEAGRVAVAEVILARVIRPMWPNNANDVCLQPWQFSCWNVGDPNRDKILSVGLGDPVFKDCHNVARDILENGAKGYAQGADHYMTVTRYQEMISEESDRPDHWIHNLRPVVVIGAHIFLR